MPTFYTLSWTLNGADINQIGNAFRLDITKPCKRKPFLVLILETHDSTQQKIYPSISK